MAHMKLVAPLPESTARRHSTTTEYPVEHHHGKALSVPQGHKVLQTSISPRGFSNAGCLSSHLGSKPQARGHSAQYRKHLINYCGKKDKIDLEKSQTLNPQLCALSGSQFD